MLVFFAVDELVKPRHVCSQDAVDQRRKFADPDILAFLRAPVPVLQNFPDLIGVRGVRTVEKILERFFVVWFALVKVALDSLLKSIS